ncbi:MAG: PQQ-binding-like beta-propeller repeat protein [Pirellulales bacterium]
MIVVSVATLVRFVTPHGSSRRWVLPILLVMGGLGTIELGSTTGWAADPSSIWPGFLGAGCGPRDAGSLPGTWSDTRNIAWRVCVPGRGQSEPIIWQDRVFATSVTDTPSLVITCLRLADGSSLWQKKWTTNRRIQIGEDYANAASTPVCDSRRVYAGFETGDILALNHAGEECWRRNLQDDFGEYQIESGWASSLAQDDALVFVLVDHEKGSYLIALSKESGATVWRSPRTQRSSWSSPVLATIDGASQLVVNSGGSVDGYDPASGRLCWRTEGLTGNFCPSPRAAGDGLFLIGACLEDQSIDPQQAWRSNVAVRIRREGREWSAHPAWSLPGGASFYTTPAAHNGAAYWIDRRGLVSCVDLTTGKLNYSHRLTATCWASPLCVGGRVYLFNRRGVTTVLAAGAQLAELSINRLTLDAADAPEAVEPALYAATGVNGSLLLRTDSRITCLRNLPAP